MGPKKVNIKQPKTKKLEEMLKERIDFLLSRDNCQYIRYNQKEIKVEKANLKFTYFSAYCGYGKLDECRYEKCPNLKNENGNLF